MIPILILAADNSDALRMSTQIVYTSQESRYLNVDEKSRRILSGFMSGLLRSVDAVRGIVHENSRQ